MSKSNALIEEEQANSDRPEGLLLPAASRISEVSLSSNGQLGRDINDALAKKEEKRNKRK